MDEQQREQLQAAAGVAQQRVQEGLGHLRRSLLIKAIMLTLLGLCALFWPGTSMKILVQLVGAFCLVDGITGLINSRRSLDGRGFMGEGLISLLIGAILLFWPGSVTLLLKLFGAWVLYTGVRNLLFSRRLSEVDPERSTLRTMGLVASAIGVILLLWPQAGVATLSWVIGIAALIVAALLGFAASRLKRVTVRVDSIGQ